MVAPFMKDSTRQSRIYLPEDRVAGAITLRPPWIGPFLDTCNVYQYIILPIPILSAIPSDIELLNVEATGAILLNKLACNFGYSSPSMFPKNDKVSA
jgi:hypothetical protein